MRMFSGQRVLIISKLVYNFQYDRQLAVGGYQFCFERKCGLAIERRSWYVPPDRLLFEIIVNLLKSTINQQSRLSNKFLNEIKRIKSLRAA
jgi:hypothetical protein